MLKNKIDLCVGDWSGDGHEKTETISIESNLTAKEINAAYKIGAKKIKFDITKKISVHHDDSTISRKQYNLLIKAGYKWQIQEFDEDPEKSKEDRINIGEPHHFACMWLFIAKLGNPDFEYNYVNSHAEVINIGGYGLFGYAC